MQLHLEDVCDMKHSSGDGYGENLFMSGGDQWTPDDAVYSWYREVVLFNCASDEWEPCWDLGIGHFS